MPNGDTNDLGAVVKKFNDFAATLPNDIPQDTYDAVRNNYFRVNAVPLIKGAANISPTWEDFKKQTDRPHLMNTLERTTAAMQLTATSAAKAALAPLKLLDKVTGDTGSGPGGTGGQGQIGGALSDLTQKENSLSIALEREGMNSKVYRGVGGLGGMIPDFALLGEVFGPASGSILEAAGATGRGAELASRVLSGGMTLGTLDAASATDGERLTAGLKGFAIGGAIDLGLSAGGFLVKRGAAASRDAADQLMKRTASGIKPPVEADLHMAEQVQSQVQTARTEGRTRLWQYNVQQPGARAWVTDVAGQTQSIEIKPFREADAYQQVMNIVRQGGELSHFEVNPNDGQKTLNEFLRIQSGIEAPKYNGTTLRTQSGAAGAVATAAAKEGLPAEAISPDTVHVGTVTHEVPTGSVTKRAPKVEPVVPAPRVKPTPEEIDAHLADVDPKDRNFVSRSIEKVWDDNIPTSAKQKELQIALKYAPHMLPPEYTEYALPRITAKGSYMFGQIDQNAVSDKVERVANEALGYPVKVTDVVTGENPNRVQVYLRGGPEEDVNENIKSILQSKLGPAYDIGFSDAPRSKKFDILGAPRSTQPRVLTDDKVQELMDFYDVPPSEVDADALTRMTEADAVKELGNVRARLDDIQHGEQAAESRPKVTDEKKRPSSFLAEKVPTSEQEPVGFGDNVHDALEASSGGYLRVRPGGRQIILPTESTDLLPSGARAAATRGTEGPVTLLREGAIDAPTVYHETLHTNVMHAGAYDEFSSHILEGDQKTAIDIMSGLTSEHPLYRGQGPDQLANEAYTHAATAIRFGDEKYLQQLADWDTDVQHVKDFVNRTSQNLLKHSIDVSPDSIPVRNLQRSVSDLIRRTSPDVTHELDNGIHITGSGTAAWYDPARGWMLQEDADSTRTFNNIEELWNHIHDNDKNFLAPNYSFMPERVGVRGGMTPEGAEPNGKEPPNPEVASVSRKLGWQGLSKWWRPTMPWAASADTALNRVLRSKGISLPIYDTMKDVDDKVAESTLQHLSWAKESSDILSNFTDKQMKDVAQYLTFPEAQRTTKIAEQFELSQDDAIHAHQYAEFLKQFHTDTGIDALGFLQRDYGRLRMHAWDPSGVWGPGISEKNAGFWEKAVRYDQDFDPKDLQLGRFNQFLLRKGVEKNFTAEPLNKLNALIQKVDSNDEYMIPANIRSAMKNYHDYMKGIPDDSKVSIEAGLGHFFDAANERIAQLNENLPGNVKVPQITLPPRQFLNRMMIMSYASGLAVRPAIAVRDGLWSLIGSSIFLGPTRFARAFTESFNPESWARAREAGALLTTENVGELYGDITSEMPTGGKNLFDRLAKWSNMLLAPSRWTHNYGRNMMFNGEYLDALDTLKQYKAGKVSIDAFFDNTTLAAMDKPAQARLLRFVNDPSLSPHDVAVRFGREAVDISQWPYRRGTQPMALRFTAGRILGQYGVWPANYVDFGARVGRLMFTQPKLATRMALMWGATNYAASKGLEGLGVDTSKWFFLSPMGFAGSPNFEFIQNLMKAPENTQEGRQARRAVLSYPLDFVPATAELEGIIKGMGEPGGDAWPPNARSMSRLLGFKPMDEHVQTRDWQEWTRYQMGFPTHPKP
jgi:hypothetical protein